MPQKLLTLNKDRVELAGQCIKIASLIQDGIHQMLQTLGMVLELLVCLALRIMLLLVLFLRPQQFLLIQLWRLIQVKDQTSGTHLMVRFVPSTFRKLLRKNQLRQQNQLHHKLQLMKQRNHWNQLQQYQTTKMSQLHQ